jgi:hypothetical protein
MGHNQMVQAVWQSDARMPFYPISRLGKGGVHHARGAKCTTWCLPFPQRQTLISQMTLVAVKGTWAGTSISLLAYFDSW